MSTILHINLYVTYHWRTEWLIEFHIMSIGFVRCRTPSTLYWNESSKYQVSRRMVKSFSYSSFRWWLLSTGELSSALLAITNKSNWSIQIWRKPVSRSRTYNFVVTNLENRSWIKIIIIIFWHIISLFYVIHNTYWLLKT